MTQQAFAGIEHLDFDPVVPCNTFWCEEDPNPAKYVIESLEHRVHIARGGRVGDRRVVCLPCWRKLKGPGVALCRCAKMVHWYEVWRITETLRGGRDE